MSLYNMLFGANGTAPMLLKILDISQEKIPRFRDCFIQCDHIVIHTRTGGGNREYYDSEEARKKNFPEDFDIARSHEYTYNSFLRENKYYLYDQDDEYDCTYANFYFSFPDEHRDDLRAARANSDNHSPSEKWKLLFESMGKEQN